MISGGDEKVRNAFRATLRDEPSRPNLGANATQELDASDILEIDDLASAIARAEEIIRLPQPRDMFDVLSAGKKPTLLAPVKTDDCIGPALPAPYGTPVPPAPVEAAPTPVPIPPPARAPVIMVPTEEDAYYHPVGKIRSLADVTLDGYKPEPTFQVKLRARRHSFGWIAGAILGPLALLGALSIFLNTASSSEAVPPTATQATQAAPPPAVTAQPTPQATATSHVTATAEPASTVPSMDVNKLPTASPPAAKTLRSAPRKH